MAPLDGAANWVLTRGRVGDEVELRLMWRRVWECHVGGRGDVGKVRAGLLG